MQGALQALAVGLLEPAESAHPAAPVPATSGPCPHVLDQSLSGLPGGDTLVEVRRGLAQRAEVHDLRWRVDSLPIRSERKALAADEAHPPAPTGRAPASRFYIPFFLPDLQRRPP
ncbi:hypothetical protein [Deinococcus sp. QL22]|uniref:hypothetical protein n=1 Tax=Deinococcus sp. QL22 TaxID=2939437 RepID=UPI0020172B09|nr:hypothetical protein [Deinococcus sp. QL22]UQN08733.1 hypothetical protein M1R55_21695 [Deinococcus sp. QL22]